MDYLGVREGLDVEVEHCAFCNRGPVIVLCVTCGHTCKGRARICCNQHPEFIHLMDYTCCPECKSTRLKECGYAAKTQRKDKPANKSISPSPTSPTLTITIPGSQKASELSPNVPGRRIVTFQDTPVGPTTPVSPLSPYQRLNSMELKQLPGRTASPAAPSSPPGVMYCGIGRGISRSIGFGQGIVQGIGRGRGKITSPQDQGRAGFGVNRNYGRTVEMRQE